MKLFMKKKNVHGEKRNIKYREIKVFLNDIR